MNKLLEAIEVASLYHDGQRRKYTNEPYLQHPLRVAGIVATRFDNEDMLAAAVLHDTLEDTNYTESKLFEDFGPVIGSLVVELTDVSSMSDGNREQRKAKDREFLATVSPAAQSIKLADLIDNTESIVEQDPGFAKVYMAEKKELLLVLTMGDPWLYGVAASQIERYYEQV